MEIFAELPRYQRQNSSSFGPYFFIFCRKQRKPFFLVYWYYLILGPIWGHFKQKMPIYRCSAKSSSKWPRKELNFKKYQKFQKLVLFVSQNASFLPKAKKYGQNGDEFHCLEANFQTPQIPGFPIHFAKYRNSSNLVRL